MPQVPEQGAQPSRSCSPHTRAFPDPVSDMHVQPCLRVRAHIRVHMHADKEKMLPRGLGAGPRGGEPAGPLEVRLRGVSRLAHGLAAPRRALRACLCGTSFRCPVACVRGILSAAQTPEAEGLRAGRHAGAP